MLTLTKLIIDKNLLAGLLAQFDIGAYYNVMRYVVVEHMSNYLAVRIALDMQRATTSNAGMSRMHFASKLSCNIYVVMHVGAFLQATSRVPRWWIGERPPDMAASCDIYK